MTEEIRLFFEGHFHLPLPWPGAVLLSILVVIALEILYRLLFGWLNRVVGLTKTTLDDVLIRRMRLPAQVLVFLVGFHVFLSLRQLHNDTASTAITIVELLLVAYLAIEAVETALIHYWLGERKGVQVPTVVRHLILVIVYTITILSIVANVTGVNVAPLLATSTVITVVVGLALQETLGNLFAGLAISLEKSFTVDDWLFVDGIEGRVVHMGWRATHLQTFTRDIVVIPNSMLGKARFQNFYRPTKILGRNQEVIVALHAAPEDVEAAVQAAIDRVPAIVADPLHKVWFVQTTPLHHRYIMRIYFEDFAIHDDVESNFMKAMFHELRNRGLQVGPASALAAVDGDGSVVAAAAPTSPTSPSSPSSGPPQKAAPGDQKA